MARTRYIKPEFFDSENVAALSFAGRVLFAGLWVLADREGRLELSARRIKARLFPYDDTLAVEPLLDELLAAALAVAYQADGKVCLWIPGFIEHQRPHPHEAKSKLPAYAPGTEIVPPWRTEAPPQTVNACHVTAAQLHNTASNDGCVQPSVSTGMGMGNGDGDHARARRSSIIARGETLAYDRQQQKLHAGCAPDLCRWRGAAVQKCMPAALIDVLAGSIAGVPRDVAAERVRAWALADVPPEGTTWPASDFAYWRERWDAGRPKAPEREDTRADGFLAMVRQIQADHGDH